MRIRTLYTLALTLFPGILFAQTQPVLLVNDLPFIGSSTDLASYLQNIFKLTLGVAVTATVLIIVVNGIRYMTSDAIGGKADAISWIKDALWGLLLAFASVVILSTINPKLVEFEFLSSLHTLSKDADIGGGGGGAPPPPPTTDPAEANLRAQLRAAGISVNKPACSSPTQTNCTNIAGLPSSAISGLISLAEECACGGFTITGGTEPGHETHGVGLPMVDIGRSGPITSFLLQNATEGRLTCKGRLYSYGGSEFLDETGGPPHWHACFGTSCSFDPGC